MKKEKLKGQSSKDKGKSFKKAGCDMKKTIWSAVIIAITIICIGCGNSKEIIEIRPKVIYPPTIEDTVKKVSVSDSVIVGVIEKGKAALHGMQNTNLQDKSFYQADTAIIVKYYPRQEKFYIKVKPDSIIVFDTIRTTLTIEKNIETPLLSKMGLVMTGIIITIAGTFIIRRRG